MTERQIDDERIIIPLIEESIQVEKRFVDRGGYRFKKTVVTREEVVDELLTTDQVSVERRSIGALLPTGDIPTVRQEGDITIYPVLKEIIVTEKRLMLVEEIVVTRNITSYKDQQSIALRTEKIDIERIEAGKFSA